jgi:hypothetical protein
MDRDGLLTLYESGTIKQNKLSFTTPTGEPLVQINKPGTKKSQSQEIKLCHKVLMSVLST